MISPIYDTNGKLTDITQITDRLINYQNKIDKCFLSYRGYKKFHESLSNLYENSVCSSSEFREDKSTKNEASINDTINMFIRRSCEVNRELSKNRLARKSVNKTKLKTGNRENAKISKVLRNFEQDNIISQKEETNENIEIRGDHFNKDASDSDTNSNFKFITPVGKVLRAIKCINLMLKATTTDIEQSKKNQQRYMLSTNNLSMVDDEEEAQKNDLLELEFSVSHYKVCKEKTLSVEAINIMKLHKALRSDDHIHAVVICLKTTVEEFCEFPKKMQYALVRHGWYEKHEPNKVIIRQGHNAQNFYFIISGRTEVKVALKDGNSEARGQTVAYLTKGKSFGELALMHGGKRNASVISMNQVELLSVTREDFIEIFMSSDPDTEPAHIEMLRHLPILEGWPIDSLPFDNPHICLFTYIRKDTILCRDSNNCDWIYIIVSGSCRIMKGLSEAESRKFQVRSSPHDMTSRLKYIVKSDNSKKVYIELKTLVAGDIFGLEAIAFRDIGATDSVMCVSNGAECVAISYSFFMKRVSQAYMRKLRVEIYPFPKEGDLFDKLQVYTDWNSFRKCLLTDAVKKLKD